jgi:hypothetical protein
MAPITWSESVACLGQGGLKENGESLGYFVLSR